MLLEIHTAHWLVHKIRLEIGNICVETLKNRFLNFYYSLLLQMFQSNAFWHDGAKLK